MPKGSINLDEVDDELSDRVSAAQEERLAANGQKATPLATMIAKLRSAGDADRRK